MADPRGFLRHPRATPQRRPVDERVGDWREVYPDDVGRVLLPIVTDQAARCMDCGIPFCHDGLPARQPDPGVERPGVPRRLGERERTAARDEQLPRVHRSAVPGALRVVVRAGHRVRPGDDQERRGGDRRPGLGRRVRAAPPGRVADRPHGRRGGLRSRRAGSGPAADPRRTHRRRLRARRRRRRAASVRDPRVQDGEALPRPADRPDAAGGTVFRDRCARRRATSMRSRAAEQLRRRRAGHRGDRPS